MPSLSKELRRLLEKTIAGDNGARRIAEVAAEQSLRRLAIDRHEPYTVLTSEERALRTQLRAYGRQVGDKRDIQRGSQSITHLSQAVAYEHWHRLLFARFLAENDLLIHPDHGVSLSLDEVKELSLSLGRDWIETAADFAQQMLLGEVFRTDDPVLKVPLAPEKRQELERLLNSLPEEVFLANDSLGWVYQFWQKDSKDRVNKSEVKIGPDEMSPVTQLFTEDYMVLFILENTLGAWWTSRHGGSNLPGYEWSYLGLNENGVPLAGGFEGWPQTAKELKVLDPCMGSGHFLTFALPIIAHMRAAEEGLLLPGAISAVLRDNLFGLELDLRCSQIAAFNLALTSWKLAGARFELPPLNLACSGLGINASQSDWESLVGGDERDMQLMTKLFDLFRSGPILGSLIDPRRTGLGLIDIEIAQMLPHIEQALASEHNNAENQELAISAKGTLAAFRILTDSFTLIATNVPYLGRVKQDPVLADYCSEQHPESKADLATCFVDRCLRFCHSGGSVALITPQSWLFLASYKRLRLRLLGQEQWNFVVRLGEHAFESPAAAGAFVSIVGLTHQLPTQKQTFAGWNVADGNTPAEKASTLNAAILCSQEQQMNNPDFRISFDAPSVTPRLETIASSYLGLGTGDYPRYGRKFWEFSSLRDGWTFQLGSVDSTRCWAGREHLIAWDCVTNRVAGMSREEREQIHNQDQSGQQAWGKSGVAVGLMRELKPTLYTGEKHDKSLAALIPIDQSLLPALWAYCSSIEFNREVRRLDQKIIVSNGTLVKVPFDVDFWRRVALEQYPLGLPTPQSSDPTQWLFHGNPKFSDNPLQVAVARLLGYRWPRQTGCSFADCSSLPDDGLENLASEYGIVCLSAVAGEEGASTRLRAILHQAYGDDYDLPHLLQSKNSKSLESWLRDAFFEEHCKLFHQVPFIWHIWDGLKDGFHVLVNYHKLDRHTMERLIYSYLGAWLSRQRQDVQNGVEGAEARLAAAEYLQREMEKILIGESPYDVFARWKPIRLQPIGWEPDPDDGVRMNIRPWITEAKLYNSTKPGILRLTPNIKYNKDRGKAAVHDATEYPWFSNGSERLNDHHLTIDEKRRARGFK